ncbi:YfhO family protein [Macrococcus armenti]|uniref:YfhO family protein n=1 Tax=Macrococcus armenti TaxID=2875764 RepID=UPI001CCD8BDE|nr:YfhO family protein [Macrococcus armenti]UBH22434.1 YfhO family protein [Macrococcus armenti]
MHGKFNYLNNKFFVFFIILCIGLIASFIYYVPDIYRYFKTGELYIGIGDGLKQMLPFQLYLYNHMKSFQMFYDVSFGLGGDYFTNLTYYYATSPVSHLTFLLLALYRVLFNHETYQLVNDMIHMQYATAIIKCALVFTAIYYMMREIRIKLMYAMLTAILYSWSTIFYYFSYTWSFYSDVMIYLPLSILGVEQLLRRKSIVVLVISIGLTMFSNFYLAYYETIIVGTYFLFRIIRPSKRDVIIKGQALLLGIVSALTGAMIGNIGFIRGVQSYLQNDRSIESMNIPLLIEFSKDENLFYGGFHLIIIFLAMVALLCFPLYKHYYFKLFSILTWILLLGSLTPYFGSMFNGFSMPQMRWVYALAFSTSVLTGLFMHYLSELKLKHVLYASIPITLIIFISFILQENKQLWIIYVPIAIILFILYFKCAHKRRIKLLIIGTLILCQWTVVQNYHYDSQLTYFPDKDELLQKDIYDIKTHKALDLLKKDAHDDLRRIELPYPTSHNVPMYYDINGTMLYSSIFNKDILKFYEKDLQIIMPKLKNSYYSGLSKRNNLMSLMNVDYYISQYNDGPALFNHYSMFNSSANYTVYKNPYQLPSVRVVNHLYAEDDLNTALDREHAMLKGAIVKKGNTAYNEHAIDIYKHASMSVFGGNLKGDTLNIVNKVGGVELTIPEDKVKQYKELYIEMYADIISPVDEDFYIKVNDYKIERPEKKYRYRRKPQPFIMNVKANNKIKISFPKGIYQFNIKHIYGEDYSVLTEAAGQYKYQDLKFHKYNNKFAVNLKGRQQGMLVIPMPYEKGLRATIDGKHVDVQKVNYMMTGIKVNKGDELLEIRYAPPYMRTGLVIMFAGIIALGIIQSLLLFRKRNKKKS